MLFLYELVHNCDALTTHQTAVRTIKCRRAFLFGRSKSVHTSPVLTGSTLSALRAKSTENKLAFANNSLAERTRGRFEHVRLIFSSSLRRYFFACAFFALAMPALIAARCASDSLRPRSLFPRTVCGLLLFPLNARMAARNPVNRPAIFRSSSRSIANSLSIVVSVFGLCKLVNEVGF